MRAVKVFLWHCTNGSISLSRIKAGSIEKTLGIFVFFLFSLSTNLDFLALHPSPLTPSDFCGDRLFKFLSKRFKGSGKGFSCLNRLMGANFDLYFVSDLVAESVEFPDGFTIGESFFKLLGDFSGSPLGTSQGLEGGDKNLMSFQDAVSRSKTLSGLDTADGFFTLRYSEFLLFGDQEPESYEGYQNNKSDEEEIHLDMIGKEEFDECFGVGAFGGLVENVRDSSFVIAESFERLEGFT